MKQIQQISQRISLQSQKSHSLQPIHQKHKKHFQPSKLEPQSVKIIKNQIYGKNIEQYQMMSQTYLIPLLVWRALKILGVNDELLKSQGIFRKSCDLEDLQILQHQIIKKNYAALQNEANPYIISGFIKKLFNNLQNPLFSHEIYNQILVAKPNGEQEQIKMVKKIISEMGSANRDTYLSLCAFFTQKVVCFQSSNKMNAYNLSVVFGPCFFRPIQYKIQDLFNSGKYSRVILVTLKFFDEIDSEYVFKYRKLIDNLKN